MPITGRGLRLRRQGAVLALTLLAGLASVAAARASGPPVVGDAYAFQVQSSTARLQGQVNPNGFGTTYRFDYITQAAYEANLAGAKDPFTGTSKSPPGSETSIGSGTSPASTVQLLSLLAAGTAYRYRLVAKNSAGTTVGPTQIFATRPQATGSLLLDGRGWEMVSPVDKNGGQVEPVGAIAGGGILQAAGSGGAVTYVSRASFGPGAEGAAVASQYVATRGATGWSTQNITAPLYAGSYATDGEGTPYRRFSTDLARSLLLSGHHCRGEAGDCAVPNPPLPGTGAPAGYQNFYLREGGAYTALLSTASAGSLALAPAEFELGLAGASPGLGHVVLSTCAALTANASEVPLGDGCDPQQDNLYAYSSSGLSLVNVRPAQSQGTPGAALAAPAAAVSSDGARIYWNDLATGNIYLREGGQTTQLDGLVGGAGTFETATADGSTAFFTKAGHLYRFQVAGGAATDLTPSGGVLGVLGASDDGSRVYYVTASGVFLHHGAATKIADAADAASYPPSTGTARVSADGTRLLFVATASLTGYDNRNLSSGAPDSQVYLYDDGAKALACVSCNPTWGRPVGPSTIPGAIAEGAYKPRALSTDGRRVFFESADSLVGPDTNGKTDVYQWEAQGTGSCASPGGCLALVSSGKAGGGASFVDASADGSDAFFLTDGSLVGADNGAVDLYDARVGGGFPEPQAPLACAGDACQPLPSAPTDPTLTTLLSGPGNPAVHYPSAGKRCKKSYVKRKGKCVKKKAKKAGKQRAKRGGR